MPPLPGSAPPARQQVLATPPPVVVPTKGREHVQAFIKDLEGSTKKFTRGRSSIEGLLDYLDAHANAPTPFTGQNEAAKFQDALGKCANTRDDRLLKYHEAIKRLVRVWGTNTPYPALVIRSTATSGSRSDDIKIARQVCDSLAGIYIADVDFSPAVREAAKAKRFGSSNLYDIVKKDYTPAVQTSLEKVMTTEKNKAALSVLSVGRGGVVTGVAQGRQAGIPLTGLKEIANSVAREGFAVCESITATIIAECKKNGFAGRLEWVGIVYNPSNKTGHSIVVAHRKGNDLNDVSTWGDFFVIDQWYYNLGMRDKYLWDGDDRTTYYNNEFYTSKPRKKYSVTQMADV
jgi:hypothetical protein